MEVVTTGGCDIKSHRPTERRTCRIASDDDWGVMAAQWYPRDATLFFRSSDVVNVDALTGSPGHMCNPAYAQNLLCMNALAKQSRA